MLAMERKLTLLAGFHTELGPGGLVAVSRVVVFQPVEEVECIAIPKVPAPVTNRLEAALVVTTEFAGSGPEPGNTTLHKCARLGVAGGMKKLFTYGIRWVLVVT